MSARTASLFAAIAALACLAAAPAPAVKIAELPAAPFVAEGVAFTPRGAMLVSAVAGRTIVQVDAGGRARPWLKGEAEGGLFGMAVDARRDRLWVAETGGDGAPDSSGPRRSGVLEVRLSDGRVLAHHLAAQDAKERWLGDVALGPDGAVYATDSKSGGVYRLGPGEGPMRLIADTGLRSPQGLAVSRDGTALIFADYPTGLHRLDLASGKVSDLPAPADGPHLKGLDALQRHGADLIATQNGTAVQRALRLRLSADERRVEAVEVLAAGPDLLEDVSLGAVRGDRFVFVARSGWEGYDAKGQATAAPKPAVIATVGLSR